MTALRYSRNGSQLASGSQDTDVILWDVIAENGLFRLRAHTAEVTDLVGLVFSFLQEMPCCLPCKCACLSQPCWHCLPLHMRAGVLICLRFVGG